MSTSAELLEGMTLDGGWVVLELLPRSSVQTGGVFSSSYRIEHPDGRKAFLKAMDFEAALTDRDPAGKLKELVDAFVFERAVIELCGSRKLSRVIRAQGSGTATPPGRMVVQYLIFEMAEGDVRKQLSQMSEFNLLWRLRCLHHLFVAVQQLHGSQIAHQDVKPSNVLGCGEDGHKIADLGRAWHAMTASPFDGLPCAGDRNYAPPELLYSGAVLSVEERRRGADFYALGSMVVFMFTGLRMTAALMSAMPPGLHWISTNEPYASVLPELQHAFGTVMSKLRADIQNDELSAEVKLIVEQMCNPDISKRGDKSHKSIIGSRFGLQRFISKLHNLYGRAQLGKFGVK
jgi:eukaryotic-like serine/threonine-protein kinase